MREDNAEMQRVSWEEGDHGNMVQGRKIGRRAVVHKSAMKILMLQINKYTLLAGNAIKNISQ